MKRRCLLAVVSLAAFAFSASADELTLKQIMARDWIGTQPESPRFTDDGKALVYEKRRPGTEIVDLFRVDVATGTAVRIEDRDRGTIDPRGAVWSRDRRIKAFVRDGDLFWRGATASALTALHQVTRTSESESDPLPLLDGRIAFRRGDTYFAFDPATGTTSTLADLRLADDPNAEKSKSPLERQQQRYFQVLRERQERKDAAKAEGEKRREADPTSAPEPWYLGKGLALLDASLSPDGTKLLVAIGPERDDSEGGELGADGGKPDKMAQFVTKSGYVEVRDVRPMVGTGKAESPKLALLDLATHERHDLDFAQLPGLNDDPLADLRAKAEATRKAEDEAEKAAKAALGGAGAGAATVSAASVTSATSTATAKSEGEQTAAAEVPTKEEEAEETTKQEATKEEAKKQGEEGRKEEAKEEAKEEKVATATAPKEEPKKEPTPRAIGFGSFVWSDDGRRAAAFAFSADNKDRWLVALDAAPAEGKPRLEPLERTQDPAWISYRFNDLGWMRDGAHPDTLWYLSEESGYGQLYLRPVGGAKRQLTSGSFELDTPRLSRDGKSFFVTANREKPGIIEVYRVDAASGALSRLTEHGGVVDDFELSADEKQVAFLASSIDRPNELFVRPARVGAPGVSEKKLTSSTTPAFEAVSWSMPEIVPIPSTHTSAPIWARVYRPADWTPGKKYPAVAFVHGAGYLQNVLYGWSPYWHEFMFHTMLTRRGYVVIDMDYRASSGYGRDWRTAIYRQMGWPEIEDYADGIQWLVANRSVDPKRIGVYGGSYGGFFTFMALFTRPELFASGAALRPVSDWAHYNHGYTANILNTPEVDPDAYAKSSPIEYAEGLSKPLLILHGMVDDNVTFQDSVRLVQRLIELGKTDYFEAAMFPVESHGFVEPSSWVDEYRRIWNLFERTLW